MVAPTFSSLQEMIIYRLSSAVFDSQGLFCPDNYKGYLEPADMAWVINRCAFLFYMTDSKRSFTKKTNHNLAQLHRWLRKWQAGNALIGKKGEFGHRILFSEIDHVIGVSVVEGGDDWCQYHLDQVQYSLQRKLSVCVTITRDVIEELASTASSARDLLQVFSDLSLVKHPVAPAQIIQGIRDRFLEGASATQSYFLGSNPQHELIQIVSDFVDWLKLNNNSAEVRQIASDLKCNDFVWLALAASALETQIARPGESGPLSITAQKKSDIYSVKVFIHANTTVMSSNISQAMSINNDPGIMLIVSLIPEYNTYQIMITVTPRSGASLLEIETAALREKALVA